MQILLRHVFIRKAYRGVFTACLVTRQTESQSPLRDLIIHRCSVSGNTYLVVWLSE